MDIGPVAELHATVAATLFERGAERTQSALEVPGAEFLLDIRHRHERRGCATRIRTGIRRIAIQQSASAWVAEILRANFAQLRSTLRFVLSHRQMLTFLIAYWLYIDGVNTIVKMAVDYGMALGFKTDQLLAALLLTQFVAFPAALVFGRIGERHGARAGVLIGLAVYTGVTCWAYVLKTPAEFFAVAVAVGLVQGGVQSLSRSFFGRLVPEGRSAEFFGFFNMVGKFGTVLGPILMGTVALVTGDPRSSILSLVLLFGVGALLLQRVRDPLSQSAGDKP